MVGGVRGRPRADRLSPRPIRQWRMTDGKSRKAGLKHTIAWLSRSRHPPSVIRPGREAWSIPPGKGCGSVICKPKAGTPRTVPAKRGPRVPDHDSEDLNDQFGPTTSPIVCVLTSSTDLTIDLDHPSP